MNLNIFVFMKLVLQEEVIRQLLRQLVKTIMVDKEGLVPRRAKVG